MRIVGDLEEKGGKMIWIWLIFFSFNQQKYDDLKSTKCPNPYGICNVCGYSNSTLPFWITTKTITSEDIERFNEDSPCHDATIFKIMGFPEEVK